MKISSKVLDRILSLLKTEEKLEIKKTGMNNWTSMNGDGTEKTVINIFGREVGSHTLLVEINQIKFLISFRVSLQLASPQAQISVGWKNKNEENYQNYALPKAIVSEELMETEAWINTQAKQTVGVIKKQLRQIATVAVTTTEDQSAKVYHHSINGQVYLWNNQNNKVEIFDQDSFDRNQMEKTLKMLNISFIYQSELPEHIVFE